MDIATSYGFFKPEIQKWVYENFDENARILDVGAGSATYYNLLCSKYKNIDAVEVYEQNIIDYDLTNKYNQVTNIDIKDFEYGYYDLIIFGDVIEHLEIKDAKNVLDYAYNHCKNMIVAVPYLLPQEANENPYEEHKQGDLTVDNVKERYPNLKLLYGNEFYGYYIKNE